MELLNGFFTPLYFSVVWTARTHQFPARQSWRQAKIQISHWPALSMKNQLPQFWVWMKFRAPSKILLITVDLLRRQGNPHLPFLNPYCTTRSRVSPHLLEDETSWPPGPLSPSWPAPPWCPWCSPTPPPHTASSTWTLSFIPVRQHQSSRRRNETEPLSTLSLRYI